MRLPFSLFLALKYLRPKRTFVSVVTVISVLGVMLGVAVLVIVLSVMSGFDDMWRERILSFNAHVTVGGDEILEDVETTLEAVRKTPGVTGAAPFVQGLVFLQHRDRVYTPIIRGIDPDRESEVSEIPKHIIRGKFSVEDDEVVVGVDLARQMGLAVGDHVLVYSPQKFSASDEVYLPEELTISGIFEIGMWEYDVGYALVSLAKGRELYRLESGVHGIQVMTADPFRAPTVAESIRGNIEPYVTVTTWMEQNRQLFGALQVEKNMMFFLLLIITVVAAFGICNTLITMTVQKTREIGLLKSLGFSEGKIMGVFFWQGFIEGVIGTFAGIGLGLLVLEYRNGLLNFMSRRFQMELLPKELYHLSEIPATILPRDIAVVGLCVLLICTLAGVIPAWRAAKLDPVRALRHD